MLVHITTAALMAMSYRILDTQIHRLHVSFILNISALIVMMPWILLKFKKIFKTEFWYIHLARAACTVIGQLILIYVYNNMNFAQVSAITLTYPLLCTLGAAIFLQEKIGLYRVIALVIGFIGALIIVNPNYNDFSFYSVYAFVAMFFWVGFDLLTKRHGISEPMVTQVLYTILFMFLLSVFPAALTKAPKLSFELFKIMPLLGILMFFYILSGIATIIESEGVSLVLPLYFLVLIISSSIGYFVFKETIARSTLIGSLIIFSSASYVAYKEYRTKKLEKMQRQADLFIDINQ